MRHLKQFIPLNNDLSKLKAFIPSLNKDWRLARHIPSKEYQIESLDVINELQKQGWYISGAYEKTNSTRKIQSHTINLTHPDFKVENSNNKPDAIATMLLNNSCDGSKPLDLNFGVFRQVCSNGAVAHDITCSGKVKHTEKGKSQLYDVICNVNNNAQLVVSEFNKLKHLNLNKSQMLSLAVKAAKIRFGDDYNKINTEQLLNVVRSEDRGDDLWTVFNRIQENLTKSNRIVDVNGHILSNDLSIEEDIRINKELSRLVMSIN